MLKGVIQVILFVCFVEVVLRGGIISYFSAASAAGCGGSF